MKLYFFNNTVMRSLLVAGSTFAIDNLFYIYLNFKGIDWRVCYVFSFLISTTYNFLLNFHWTFNSGSPFGTSLTRYLSATLLFFILNGIILRFVYLVTKDAIISKLIVALLLYPLVFFYSKKIIFR